MDVARSVAAPQKMQGCGRAHRATNSNDDDAVLRAQLAVQTFKKQRLCPYVASARLFESDPCWLLLLLLLPPPLPSGTSDTSRMFLRSCRES